VSEALARHYRYHEPGHEWDGLIWTVVQHWPGTYGSGVALRTLSGIQLTVHSSMLVAPEWEPLPDEGEQQFLSHP